MPSASFSKKTTTMKKKRITYGVPGMMEYQGLIRFGRSTLKVNFSGGSMNAIGVTPATFTTGNFLIQQAIENSSEFKRGRIRIERAVELDEELKIEKGQPLAAEAAQPEQKGTGNEERGTGGGAEAPGRGQTNGCGGLEGAEAPEPEQINGHGGIAADPIGEEATGVQAGAEQANAEAASLTQVEFPCNDDAKDYLEETFGCVRSKLRNREDIVNAGKTHGVDIIFV